MKTVISTATLMLALLLPAATMAQAVNDYPTNARAEYVFTCMATNGQNREMLDRCACAIDQIATVLPFDDYVRAETVLRMQQVSGERASMFKGMAEMNEFVARLRRAEAEAEILCF